MKPEARRAVVEHAVRWALNMVAEVLLNHGSHMSERQRGPLKRASQCLQSFPFTRDNEDVRDERS